MKGTGGDKEHVVGPHRTVAGLHRGAFDLRDGEVVVFPTTGGLSADGESRPPWMPEGAEAKPPPTDAKARARALTRVRRLRYFPVRVVEGRVEVALPG